MDSFGAYQSRTHSTAIYPGSDTKGDVLALSYLSLGLNGEAGEVADHIKKAIRDDGGDISEGRRALVLKEIGDCLWYMSELCSQLQSSLGEVAAANLSKLQDRKARGALHGSGDLR